MNERKKNNRQYYKDPPPTSSDYRVPPQDLDAEQAVLGSMILDSKAIHIAQESLSETDFYREAHRKTFEAIVDLNEDKKPVDILTLSARLRDMGEFETVGGVTALTTLVERVPTSANVEYYAQIVQEKSQLRKVITACTQSVSDAYADSEPVKEICENAEKRIFEAVEMKGANEFKNASNLLGGTIEGIAATSKGGGCPGMPTGFDEMDSFTGGFHKGEFILLAAMTSVGKTSLALQWAINQAAGFNSHKTKYPVGFYSLEMTNEQMMQRAICTYGEVDSKKVRNGTITKNDLARLVESASKLHGMALYLNDTSHLSISDLTSKARRLKYEKGIEAVYVDYLQLVECAGEDTREQEVSKVSRRLKGLAKDLNIPVIALAQFSRPPKGQEERKPRLSDLRESGALEQDADVVIFIHRETGTESGKKHFKYETILAKQRNGPANEEIEMVFLNWACRFWEKKTYDKKVNS